MIHPKPAVISVISILLLVFSVRAHGQIVAFGASSTSEWDVAPSEATPAQLQAMLQQRGYNVRVLDKDIYGNTTVEMLGRVDSDVPQGTSIVILDVSASLYNDVRIGISRAQGQADLAAIRAKLEARHIKVIPFSAASLPAQYHQQDGTHLTPEGHHLAAASLLTNVTAALGPPSAPSETVRDACVADVRRLCAAAIQDEAKRQACMHEHRAQLSSDCQHAMAESRQHGN
jgi:acyl-CoA thioesterase I